MDNFNEADGKKLGEIRDLLKSVYADRLPEDTLNDFADDLYDSLFAGQYGLSDIICLVNEYESAAGIEDSEDIFIFTSMIYLLDDNEVTAQRLYDSFMHEIQLLETFVKLVNDNAEYLSAEQLAEVKAEGLQLFDKQILELYGITEDE